MRKSEREFFLNEIRPYLREGENLVEWGCAVVYSPGEGLEKQWYIDCPSGLGSTGRHQIGQIKQTPGFKSGLVCWTEVSDRFTGKGWMQKLLAEFLRQTDLSERG